MTSAAAQSQQDKDAATPRSFQAEVVVFLELHHRLESSIVSPALPADAMTLYTVADAVRDQLKRARVGTTEGKLFTPRAATVFRRIIAQTVHGDYAALMRATHEDREELGRALINDRWPGTALTRIPTRSARRVSAAARGGRVSIRTP